MTKPAREVLADYFNSLPFTPDDYQREALNAVAAGHSVVVTAPTGAGKTVVADGSIALAISKGTRAFYTTPIKALSNQKFSDLISVHGEDAVGLLTGDNVINGDAAIVVMTTEVLRNMIYEGSAALDALGVVVLDEVHYLADRNRGSVWEEVIIHLDRSIPLVCLSATIANASEFTDWVAARRGPTDLVVEEHRPVPLTSMYMWRDRNSEHGTHMLPVFARNGRPNPTISKLLSRSRGRRQRFSTPRRVEVVRELADTNLLPAIYFLFSRKGCDQTAEMVAGAGLGLTTSDEKDAIREIAARHVAHLSEADLAVLGYERWVSTLERGAAPHHAGLVPAFKEAAEELFLKGFIKVVAATETLALGINMPARTVVLESLSKFNGESHELLQPSDYTQLTGRAGRRGIDEHGTAVVLHSSYVPFERVSGIAAAGSNPLRSSFAPTYNMTVNLIARYDESRAHELLAASFANFSDNRRYEQLADQLDERRNDVATFRSAASCERGDIWTVSDGDDAPRRPKANTRIIESGSVMDISGTRLVVLGRSWGGNVPRLELVDRNGSLSRINIRQLPVGSSVVGTISVPNPVRRSDPVYRREVGSMLDSFVPDDEEVMVFGDDGLSPVLACPDLDVHLHWVDRARRAERDVRRLERRMNRGAPSDVVSEFDRLHKVLDKLGYTHGWRLAPPGASLRRLYNEMDLLLSEALRAGVFANLSPAEFAAVLSVFTYETRGGEIPQAPHAAFGEAPIAAIDEIAQRVASLEDDAGVEPGRVPDVGLVDVMHGWAEGLHLDEIFDEEDVRAGDFVRAARQVLDLLRQVRDGFPEVGKVAQEAIALVDRGIVEVGFNA
jgi:ATP-dependent RNA helicase HelY